MKKSLLLLIPVLLMMIAGCNPSVNTASDPKKAVIQMFKAMEENDREKLAHYLDFESLLKTGESDYALQMDSVRKFTNPQEILDDLLQGGLTNQRWQSLQRIVGSGSQMNDSALVEVSFINKATSTQYYNKFGLRKVNGVWKIYSFSVPEDK
jgi:hypothetical protein